MKNSKYMNLFMKRLVDALEAQVWCKSTDNSKKGEVEFLSKKGISSHFITPEEYMTIANYPAGCNILDDEVLVFSWHNWTVYICEATCAIENTTGENVSQSI